MKKLLVFCLALFLGLFLHAGEKPEFTGSLLWKISGKDLKSPSYIFGTHHLTSKAIAGEISGLTKAMEETEQTIGEIVLLEQGDMAVKLQMAAMMPAGTKYSDLLSEEDYNKLDKGLKELLGAGLDQFGVLKPGMLSSLYTITLFSKMSPDYNPATHEAMDIYLQKEAHGKGKTIKGLETLEDQIEVLFNATPLKDQAESLVCTVSNPDFSKELLLSLNAYYSAGLLDKMYALSFANTNDPCPAPEEWMEALNKKRNDKWMKVLPEYIKEKSSLVAVGALHLAGEEGLLSQLKKLGYTVEAVK